MLITCAFFVDFYLRLFFFSPVVIFLFFVPLKAHF